MRVTQSMMSRQYTSRVSSVLNSMNYANKQVGTGRKFFKGSENPGGALQAYQLRRQSAQTEDYLMNLQEASSSLQTKGSSMTQVNKALDDVYSSLLGVLNGTNNAETKAIVAQQLRSAQETIVMDMNTKYGDKFLFGGSGVSDVPFAIQNGSLTYRGVDVSGKGDFTWPDGTVEPSMDVLNELSQDVLYTDLGFGLSFSNGEVVGGSAYNTATVGINVLGYGTDSSTGMSNNVVLLLGQIAEKLDANCASSEIDAYVNKFLGQKQTVLNSLTKVSSESTFLEYSKARLEDVQDNLSEKSSWVEDIDAEEAIMNLNMIDYMYQATLKTSSNILSLSFIDFMK